MSLHSLALQAFGGLITLAVLPCCGPSTESGGSSSDSPPVVSFGVGSLQETEITAEIRIPVVLNRTADVAIQVGVQIGGTASFGNGASAADFFVEGGTLVTIPAGFLSTDLVILPIDDGTPEDSETILLQLGTPSFGELGAQTFLQVTLLDGDGNGDITSDPFGTFLIVATDLDNPSTPQIHTAEESDASTLTLTSDSVQVRNASVSPDGGRMAYEGFSSSAFFNRIFVLNSAGGEIVQLSGDNNDARGPLAWSPNSDSVAYVEAAFGAGPFGMVLADPNGQDEVNLQVDGYRLPVLVPEPYRWSPDSQRIAFLAEQLASGARKLFAYSTATQSGPEVSISLPASDSVDEGFQWSQDGEWLAFSAESKLYVVRASGTDFQVVSSAVPPANGQAYNFQAQWNPGTNQLGFLAEDPVSGGVRLAAIEIPGGNEINLSAGSTNDVRSRWAWSPDGSRAAYIARHGGIGDELRVVDADGSNNREVSSGLSVLDLRWSPTGDDLAYRASEPGSPDTLWTGRADGSGGAGIFVGGDPGEEIADFESYEWSPDGSRISYASALADISGSGKLVSDLAGGSDPRIHLEPIDPGHRVVEHRWSPDGARIHLRLETLVGTELVTGLRSISVDQSAEPLDPTSNLYNGAASVSQFFVR